MKLSVLIPVYNEQETLAELLERVRAVPLDKEIIVVDDCSTDNTPNILASFSIPNLQIIRHEINRGKGVGIRSALDAATGDVIIIPGR